MQLLLQSVPRSLTVTAAGNSSVSGNLSGTSASPKTPSSLCGSKCRWFTRPNPSLPPDDMQHQPEMRLQTVFNQTRRIRCSLLTGHCFEVVAALAHSWHSCHQLVPRRPTPTDLQAVSTAVWPHELSAASQTVQGVVGGAMQCWMLMSECHA